MPILTLFWDIMTYVAWCVTPKLIILDGEFTTTAIMGTLQQKGYPFIGRHAITNRMKALALAYELTDNWKKKRKWTPITFLNKAKNRTTTVPVTFQQEYGHIKALVKSPDLPFTPDEVEKLYSIRFTIETGYRDKHDFQAQTCSKHLAFRLLLFLFACMLWNVWNAFLLLVPSVNSPYVTRLNTWRRRKPAIRLFTLRDELL